MNESFVTLRNVKVMSYTDTFNKEKAHDELILPISKVKSIWKKGDWYYMDAEIYIDASCYDEIEITKEDYEMLKQILMEVRVEPKMI